MLSRPVPPVADVGWGEPGRAYQGRLDQQLREPQLFECADYHRPTMAAGWVTFEVRDADAKGLLLYTCLGTFGSCETPALIRLR